MAGTNHHILPKFLLKGFASKIEKVKKKEKVFVWWYRIGHESRETNIDKINAEQHFYGNDGGPNVDPAITNLELGFSTVIGKLRNTAELSDITQSGIIEFISHLTSRTRHLRESLVDSTDILFTELEKHYSDEAVGRAFIRDHFSRHPEVITDIIEQVISRLPVTGPQRRFVAKRLRQMPKATLINKIERDFPEFFTTYGHQQLEAFKLRLPDLVKSEHIKLLVKSLIPEPKVDAYRKLKWTVLDSTMPLILGDVGCLFVVDGYEKWISMAGPNEHIRYIFLPISSKKLVVGYSDDPDPSLDFGEINHAFAMRSREFFIADSQSAETLRYKAALGQDTAILSMKEITKIIIEAGHES